MSKYDYLIVGCGLFGACFANQSKQKGKSCLILDRRPHIAGNCYTEMQNGIQVHKYGAHIFHTNNKIVWNFVNSHAIFMPYIHEPLASWRGELYNLPFNMNTFRQMWGVTEPDEARRIIEDQQKYIDQPKTLEEQAIKLVGTDIYEKLIKGYTQKQWGRECDKLPPFIIKRLPVRFTYDNNYFNDKYQGIPADGYTAMVASMIDGIDIELNADYLIDKEKWDNLAEKVIYTGAIDEYFNYHYGQLAYRSLRFETELLNSPNFQSAAVVNYTDTETPYTRIIEHKHFLPHSGNETIITKEYSIEWTVGAEPYYPVNDTQNSALLEKYNALAQNETKTIFCGRLGEYKYYDMDKVIEKAFSLIKKLTGEIE